MSMTPSAYQRSTMMLLNKWFVVLVMMGSYADRLNSNGFRSRPLHFHNNFVPSIDRIRDISSPMNWTLVIIEQRTHDLAMMYSIKYRPIHCDACDGDDANANDCDNLGNNYTPNLPMSSYQQLDNPSYFSNYVV